MPTTVSPLQELADAAQGAHSFRVGAEFDLSGGKTLTAEIAFYPALQMAAGPTVGYVNCFERKGETSGHAMGGRIASLDDGLRQVATRYPKAALRLGSVTVSVTKGATTGTKLRTVAVQAWHEAFGRPIPTAEEVATQLKAAKAAKKEADGGVVALLRSGPEGVAAFNAMPPDERSSIDLSKADLAGADLAGVDFAYRTRMHEVKLAGARLAGASLALCRCNDADLAGADLAGANLRGAGFLRANFAGANLAGAFLSHSDFRGADFTGADLSGCEAVETCFDEATKWPKGYKPDAKMTWKGTGVDPRLAPSRREKNKPKPTDFAGFLKRLQGATDASKLDKAMAMLKADRFRLFARVGDDGMTGVVKSQSDPSLVYSCRLGADGQYSCCTQNLNVCGGLRGSPCKHLLVLLVGLTQAGEVDPGTAHDWAQASRGRKPALDKDAMTETLLQYKGAEAGEVDWRPTETLPEDFYAM